MVDLHTHILPNMDDGARDVAESVRMLKTLWDEGVSLVFLTPHFYREDEDINEFLQRRSASFEDLSRNLGGEKTPKILPGAEVALYHGISDDKDIKKLCLGGTGFLLLEMPFTPWRDWMFNEVYLLMAKQNIVPIIAHIERYPLYLKNMNDCLKLLAMDVYAQINVSATYSCFERRIIKKLYSQSHVDFVGSDCHDLNNRPPNFKVGLNKLEKLLGPNFKKKIEENSKLLLGSSS